MAMSTLFLEAPKKEGRFKPSGYVIIFAILGLIEVIIFNLYYLGPNYWMHTNNNQNQKGVKSSLARYTMTSRSRPPNRTLLLAKGSPNALTKKRLLELQKNASLGVNATQQRLIQAGVTIEELDNTTIANTPPWWQILQNYGEEPVIIGLEEHCQAYQDLVPYQKRHIGPTGLFSTGTNLLHNLLKENCIAPGKTNIKDRPRFNLWQVPWGKHNPEYSRGRFWAPKYEKINHTNILPIVTVRHPYTWMLALCKHQYSLTWTHDRGNCEKQLNLQKPVRAHFGASRNVRYQSLLHVWRDWNYLFYKEKEFPFLIVRHEDLVFRPQTVIQKICECVGGHLTSSNSSSSGGSGVAAADDDDGEFHYITDSLNVGRGHGHDRSDFVTAWIKYGQPLVNFYYNFSEVDWKVIQETLDNDYGMMEAFGYPR